MYKLMPLKIGMVGVPMAAYLAFVWFMTCMRPSMCTFHNVSGLIEQSFS